MRWPGRRRRAPQPQPNPVRAELVEHALAGTEPPPGSQAATILALSRSGTCLRHSPMDTSRPGEAPGTRAVCDRCWRPMALDDAGSWKITTT